MSLPATIVRLALSTVPRLSFDGAAAVGRTLGYWAWTIDGRHRRVAERNLAAAFPKLPPARHQRLAREAFGQIGRSMTELLWSPALHGDYFNTVGEVSGLHLMNEALERRRGALLVSAHFGNWELMGVVFGLLGMPLHVIARRLADAQLEAILLELRTSTGNQVIYKDDAVRDALRALREGHVVAVMIDQNTLRSQATFVPFFGRPAATTRLLAQLHLRTNAPIVPAFAVPHDSGYRFVIEPPLPTASSEGDGSPRPQTPVNNNADIATTITAAATSLVERYVRRHPEAWLWLHDRWRTRPR